MESGTHSNQTFRGRAVGGPNAWQWVYGHLLFDFEKGLVIRSIIDDPNANNLGAIGLVDTVVNDRTIGRYVGIEYANGDPVYEGDITFYDDPDWPDEPLTHAIVWGEYGWGYEDLETGLSATFSSFWEVGTASLGVKIGTIYDDPKTTYLVDQQFAR